MKKHVLITCMIAVGLFAQTVHSETHRISRQSLQDKIKGGWAGQAIGCTFGGPTEFRFGGTFIPDYQPILWDESRMKWYYDNSP